MAITVCSELFSNLKLDERFFESVLSLDETLRAEKFRNQRARDEFVLSRGYLRQQLSQQLHLHPSDIEISIDSNGKPFLADLRSNLEFNISHSDGRVALAMSFGQTVGIDIEKINPYQNLEIARIVFSSDELREFEKFQAAEKIKSFFKGWTQKEAFIKALGLGMNYPLKAFSVSMDPNREAELLEVKDDPSFVRDWTMHNLQIDPEYSCSLFVRVIQPKIILAG